MTDPSGAERQLQFLLDRESELRVRVIEALLKRCAAEVELDRVDPAAKERNTVWGPEPVPGAQLSESVHAAWWDWMRAEARADRAFISVRAAVRRRRALERASLIMTEAHVEGGLSPHNAEVPPPAD